MKGLKCLREAVDMAITEQKQTVSCAGCERKGTTNDSRSNEV